MATENPIRIKITGQIKNDEHGPFYSACVFDADTGRQLDNVTGIQFLMTGDRALPEVSITFLNPELDLVCDITQTKGLLEKSDKKLDLPGTAHQQ